MEVVATIVAGILTFLGQVGQSGPQSLVLRRAAALTALVTLAAVTRHGLRRSLILRRACRRERLFVQ